MKKLIFAAAVLAAITGVSVSKTEAAWPFNKKAETKTERKVNVNSASIAAVRALRVFEGESKDAKLTIMKKGEDFIVVAGGATVKTNTSGILNVNVGFGVSAVALTVVTTADTKVFRHYDGHGSTVADISAGDIISFNGSLDTTAASLTVTANKIKDYSLQKVDADYGGVVSELNIEEGSDGKVGNFKLPLANQSGKFITVFANANTKIASASPGLKLSDMKNGDFVISATGIVNTQKSELRAGSIRFSTTGKTTQARWIDNQYATVDFDQKSYGVASLGLSTGVKTVFVKTTAGKRLEVRIDEAAMTGAFSVKRKGTTITVTKGIYKRMVKEQTSVETTLADLNLTGGDVVWVSGLNFIKDGAVNAYRLEKRFNE